MITVESVTHAYRRDAPPALDGVSLRIDPGERVALLGPSGAGKSTLLRCLNGLVRPERGSVRFRGLPVNAAHPGALRQVRRSIAMIFQEYHLIESYTALGNALAGRFGRTPFWRTALGLWTAAERHQAGAALARVGLAGYDQVPVRELSGGQRQRVAIARALVQEAEVILGDEPVSSLDPGVARSILALLVELNQRDGITLVLSLHDPQLALRYCHRVVALSAGRILWDQPAAEVRPDHLATLYGMAA